MRLPTINRETAPGWLTPQGAPWQHGRRGAALLAVLVILALITTVLTLSANSLTLAQNSGGTTRSLTLSWPHPGDGSVSGYQYSTDNGVTWHEADYSGGDNAQHSFSSLPSSPATVFMLRAVSGTPGQGSGSSTRSLTLSWPHTGAGNAADYQYSTDHGATWQNAGYAEGTSAQYSSTVPTSPATVLLLRASGGVTVQAITPSTPTPSPTPETAASTAGRKGPIDPNAPVLEAEGTGPHEITLTWSEATEGTGTPPAAYEIEWSPNGNSGTFKSLAIQYAANPRSYADAGCPSPVLQPGTVRWYRVRATDSESNHGPWSQAVGAATPTQTRPAPVLTAVASSPGAISLSWTDPSTGLQETGVYQYILEWSPDGEACTWRYLTWLNVQNLLSRNADPNSYEDHITPGTTGFYRVRATFDDLENGPWSRAASATSTVWPPGNPYAEAQVTGADSVLVAWSDPSTNDHAPVINYELEVSNDGGSAYSPMADNLSGTTHSYMHSGLATGTQATYRVRACNAGGCGEWGETQTVTVGTHPVPTAPVLTAQARTGSAIALRWTQANGGSAGVTGYDLERSANGQDWSNPYQRFYDNQLGYDETGIAPDTTVHYRVRALNANGAGAWSEIRTATTGAAGPPPPANLRATVAGDDRIDLSWQAPAGASGVAGYHIERANVDQGLSMTRNIRPVKGEIYRVFRPADLQGL